MSLALSPTFASILSRVQADQLEAIHASNLSDIVRQDMASSTESGATFWHAFFTVPHKLADITDGILAAGKVC